jgi:hypothetical protein
MSKNTERRAVFASISPAHAMAVRMLGFLDERERTTSEVRRCMADAENPRGISGKQLSDLTAKLKKYLTEQESQTLLVVKLPGRGGEHLYKLAANDSEELLAIGTMASRALGYAHSLLRHVEQVYRDSTKSERVREVAGSHARLMFRRIEEQRVLQAEFEQTHKEFAALARVTAARPTAEELGVAPDNQGPTEKEERRDDLATQALLLFPRRVG